MVARCVLLQDLPARPGGASRRLVSPDIDHLFIKTQNLRWILVGEASMVSTNLLADFQQKMREAAVETTAFFKRSDGSRRIFGGYNVLFFGDWWQLPPIPNSAALFHPPQKGAPQGIRDMLNIFWSDGPDSLNALTELTLQNRCKDPWYNQLLLQARQGRLEEEYYDFLHGFPTRHCGSWVAGKEGADASLVEKELQPSPEYGAKKARASSSHSLAVSQSAGTPAFGEDVAQRAAAEDIGRATCGNKACAERHLTWDKMAQAGKSWADMVAMEKAECKTCTEERQRRRRLLESTSRPSPTRTSSSW